MDRVEVLAPDVVAFVLMMDCGSFPISVCWDLPIFPIISIGFDPEISSGCRGGLEGGRGGDCSETQSAATLYNVRISL
jgi:hypothetical protein